LSGKRLSGKVIVRETSLKPYNISAYLTVATQVATTQLLYVLTVITVTRYQ